MKNLFRLLAAFSLLLSMVSCRDRDSLLGPDEPAGTLLVSVRFEGDTLAAEPVGPANKTKKIGQKSLLAQASSITSIHALVFDESLAARTLLTQGELVIDLSSATFSGTLEVTAGEGRVVAVQAHTAGGISYLGISPKLTVPAGGTATAEIELKNYIPVISHYDAVTETGDFTLQWVRIPLAAGYIVYESPVANFATSDSVVLADQTSASFSARPRGLRYLRLRAYSDYAFGALSDTVSVRITSAPQAEIVSPASGASVAVGESILFLGRAFDEEEGYLKGSSVIWTSSRDGVFAAGNFVLYDRLSEGNHLVTMTARNSFGALSSDTVSLTLTVGGNRAPEVTLTNPGNGASFNQAQAILFLASGIDPEDGPLPENRFYWVSNLDGYFGSGQALGYSSLSLGAHLIKVVGIDAAGAAGWDSVSLSVLGSGANTAPQVQIITPTEGAEFGPGAAVLLQGTARDAEEGLLGPDAFVWSSSLDGPLGTGAVKLVENLSAGGHTIYLTASDALGAADRDSVRIVILLSGGNQSPSASITLPLDGSKFSVGADVRFAGGGFDPETGVLDNEETLLWFTTRLGILGRGPVLDYGGLPLGRHTVYLAAVDPQGAAGLDSVNVEIVSAGGNQAPNVAITSPPPGARFTGGVLVYLAAVAADPEDGPLSGHSVSWQSSLDGFLGYGEELFAGTLSEGIHLLKAIAVDHAGGVGTDSVTVQVVAAGGEQAPEARILSPAGGSRFSFGAGVLFAAEVSGITAEQAESGAVWWSSSLSGLIGRGVFFVEDGLALGRQKIYLTALSESGAAARDSVQIEVVAAGGNRSPVVSVLSPKTMSIFPGGVPVTFLGLAQDPEDGLLTGEALTWVSSLAGKFGSGDYFTSSSLPSGFQWVYLVAVDRAGAAGKDSVQIQIQAATGNQAPVAGIVYPVDGVSFAVGTPVLFSGAAADPEEGQLAPGRLSWYSSRDGLLGTGDYLLRSDLTQGEHQVRLLAVDSDGLTGSAEVTIQVVTGGNRSPGVEITSPPDRSAFVLGSVVAFSGIASDPEEGVLGGQSLSWISNIDGSLGSGSSISAEGLSAGLHRIILLAFDSQGAGAMDSILVSLSRPPEVQITRPINGATYPIGAPIEFSGSASDPEEGILSGTALTWWCSFISGPIGIGASFITNSLGIGTHRITLIATDRLGIKDSAAVTISVVAVPDSIVAAVAVGSHPLRIDIDPVGRKAYVTNSGESTVSVVDLEEIDETNRIGVGVNPAGLDVSPNLGRVYVANSSENSVSVIRGGSIEQTIPVGFQPVGVAVGPDESQVYVSNSNAASISVISTVEGKVVRTIINVGNSPQNMLIPPGSGRLFVSNYGSRETGDIGPDEVAAIELSTDIITRIPVRDKPLGLCSTVDGTLLFVANSGSNSVSVISTVSLSPVTTISVGQRPTSCAVTPDNNQLYVVNSGSRSISVIDIGSKVVVETISDIGTEPYDIAIYEASDGRVLALVTDRGLDMLKVLLVR
ncbi:MAG TPA: YncE family protein [archaeon]|nr:YncE family protein [archaeon]